MCSPTTCRQCGKTTWTGCGQHVDQVRAHVPADQWCDGTHDTATQTPTGGAYLGQHAAGTPRTLTAADFEATVTVEDIVLVDFWASWCGPCRAFAPVFEHAAREHPDIVFAKVDTEAEQTLAAAAQITSIPTLMAFKGGHLVFRQPGALPAKALEELISAVRDLDVDAMLTEVGQARSA